MRKLKGIVIIIIVTIVMLLIIEAMIPTADGITIGFLGVFWTIINSYYLQDWVLSAVLFVVCSISAFGTVQLSRRNENNVWSIVTGIVTVASFIAMLARCSGGN